MSEQAQMPERVLLRLHPNTGCITETMPPDKKKVEYIRADIHATAITERDTIKGKLLDIERLVKNDSYAMTFQTLGQYRTALLEFIKAPLEKPE